MLKFTNEQRFCKLIYQNPIKSNQIEKIVFMEGATAHESGHRGQVIWQAMYEWMFKT